MCGVTVQRAKPIIEPGEEWSPGPGMSVKEMDRIVAFEYAPCGHRVAVTEISVAP